MIIEFIGLMGAGKSTLHRETIERLTRQGVSVWTPGMLGQLCGRGRLARLQRLWYRLRAAWRSRLLVILAIRHLFGSHRALRDKMKGLRWFLTSLGNRWKARQVLGADDVAIIDEGLAQRMFNIFIHGADGIDLRGVRKYARAQPLADVLIYIKVNPSVAAFRTATRTKKLPRRFRSLSRSQLDTMFANADRAIDVLVDEIQTAGSTPVQVIVIDGDDLADARRELHQHLDAILDSRRRPVRQVRRSRSDSVPELATALSPARRRR